MSGSHQKDDSNGPEPSTPRYNLRSRDRVDDAEVEDIEMEQAASRILKRMQQSCAYINPHLKKIKMEEDYVPIPKIKDEPGVAEEGEQQLQPLGKKNQVRKYLDAEFNGREEEEEEEQSNVEQREIPVENQMNLAAAEGTEFVELNNPMLNEKFVNSVLKYVKKSSLKSCRLICKFWDEKAIKMLFENSFIQIPFNFYLDFNPKTKKEKTMILDKLKERFSRFGSISNVIINSELDVYLFRSLEVLREQVKNIKINLWPGDLFSYIPVLKTIIQKCPNLNLLDVQQKEEEAVNCSVKPVFGLSLMTACHEYQAENKGHFHHTFTVSELVADLRDNYFNFSMFQNFAESKVRINNLAISHNLNKPTCVIELMLATNKILEYSKDNVENFSYTSKNQMSIFELRIPVLPNLHTLDLTLKLILNSAFDPDIEFSKYLPNLKNLSLRYKSSSISNCNPNPIASAGPAPSVKNLCYMDDNDYSTHCYNVGKQFDQVEELFYSFSTWESLSEICILCRKLKKLTLVCKYPLSSAEKYCCDFLTNITGINKEHLKSLWDSSEELDVKKIIESRTGSSIHDLKDLEFLTIKLPCEKFVPKILSLLQKLTCDALPKLLIIVEVGRKDAQL